MIPLSDSPRSTILIVDDSPESVAMLADVVEAAGLTAMMALRADRALEIAQKVTPDLVLLDAIMPGMDGFELCRLFKRDAGLARVPVIFMTGLNSSSDVVRGLESGGVDYLTKPVDPKELVARIRVHLSNARVEQSVRSALDTTGRFLFALDRRGCLTWWTTQTGPMLARILGADPVVGAPLPADIAEAVAGNADMARLSIQLPAGAPPSPALIVEGVSALGANEVLFCIREDRGAGSFARRLQERFDISGREAEVLCWLSQGKANRDIAEILDLSPRTVNKHLERIFRKIGVENRTAAAAMVLSLNRS